MDKTSQKVVTFSFLMAGILLWLVAQILITTMAATFAPIARIANNDFSRHVLPAFLGVALFLFLQFNSKTLAWADDVVVELKKVIWPPKKDLTAMTIVVVVMLILSGVIISFFDFVSVIVIGWLMKFTG